MSNAQGVTSLCIRHHQRRNNFNYMHQHEHQNTSDNKKITYYSYMIKYRIKSSNQSHNIYLYNN